MVVFLRGVRGGDVVVSLGPDMGHCDCRDKLDNVEWLVHYIEQ
jgi:hypothetical protein